MYVYSVAPHVVVNARAADGACEPSYSTTFEPISNMHRQLWLHGSGTASLVRASPPRAPCSPCSYGLVSMHASCIMQRIQCCCMRSCSDVFDACVVAMRHASQRAATLDHHQLPHGRSTHPRAGTAGLQLTDASGFQFYVALMHARDAAMHYTAFAYKFEAQPPFAVLGVSARLPLQVGDLRRAG
jgi:hypothetical protein